MCITKEEVKKAVFDVWENELEPKIFRIINEKNETFLPTAIARGIMEAEKHMEMSKPTRDEFNKVNSWISKHEELARGIIHTQEKITLALFGDPSTDEIGVVRQSNEMYKKMMEMSGIKGFFQWVLLSGGVVALLYSLFKKF